MKKKHLRFRQLPLEQSLVDNPVLTIESKDPPYIIAVSGASSDRFALFEATGTDILLVLKTNRPYRYAQLTEYDRGRERGEILVEGNDLTKCLGEKGMNQSEARIAERLYPFVIRK